MFTYENAKIITTNILNKATNLTTCFLSWLLNLPTHWQNERGQCWHRKGQYTGSVTIIMHDPAATWGGDTCYARGGGQPQSRRHSPTARSSQRHVPSATTARASQERKAEAKGERSGQRSANRNYTKEKPGIKQVSAERLNDGSKEWN